MKTSITCNHCKSTNILAIDNQPLDHSEGWLEESELQFDNEIYIECLCDDCQKTSVFTMDIVPRIKEVQEDSITVFRKKLEAFAKAAEEQDNALKNVDNVRNPA